MVIGLSIVATVAALVVGFALGQNRAVTERKTSAFLGTELEQAQFRIEDLNRTLIDAELAASVQKDANQALRQDLTALFEQNARLNEELTFYKSLMAPSSLPQGLQISELAIEPTAQQDEFQFQLLLTQIAKRRSYIAGSVHMDVVGERDNAQAVLSLTELSDMDTYPLAFRFRYFQDMAGIIKLPEGFTPERVLVTATLRGGDPMQTSFEWRVGDAPRGNAAQTVLD
jgi:hypothetical protein